MKYEINRTRMALLSVCLVLLIMLSFTAGLVAGIGLWMPTRAEIALLKRRSPEATAHVSAPPPVHPNPPAPQPAAAAGGPEPALAPVTATAGPPGPAAAPAPVAGAAEPPLAPSAE